MARSIAQSRATLHQSVARQLARDVKLQEREVAERNRRLYQLGELTERIGLANLEHEVLAGLLLAGKAALEEERVIRRYREAGKAFLTPPVDLREPAVARFPGPITRNVANGLKGAGLSQNRIQNCWEGMKVDFETARILVEAAGGTIERLNRAENTPEREAAE